MRILNRVSRNRGRIIAFIVIELLGVVRCLPALPFVPHKMSRKLLTCLLTPCLMGRPIDHMDEAVTYFQHTYVRGRLTVPRLNVRTPRFWKLILTQNESGQPTVKCV